jgi:hypothetical protein
MKRLFAFGVILAALGGVLASPVPAEKPQPMKPSEFLYRAVLEGLTEDGVEPELAESFSSDGDSKRQIPYFLAKCPLCNATRRAFIAYAERKSVDKPKEGKGLSEDLAKRLKSKDNDVCRSALRELVAGYVDRGYERSKISADERKSLEKELLAMRGSSKASGDKFFCPSCDGACRILAGK